MGQPVFWTVLMTFAIVGVGTRLVLRRPLWSRRSAALRPWELASAGVSVLLLAFHCAAMFFVAWVEAVPLLDRPADAVRALGNVSEVLYWAPAGVLILATRQVWWPVLAALIVALVGVGVTMFWPYGLTTHLAWIAAAVLMFVVTGAGLVTPQTARR